MREPTDSSSRPGGDLDQDPVATLLRWERSGAVWRVLGRSRTDVTIGLFSCDGGEEMGRITSSAGALLSWVDARPDSES